MKNSERPIKVETNSSGAVVSENFEATLSTIPVVLKSLLCW